MAISDLFIKTCVTDLFGSNMNAQMRRNENSAKIGCCRVEIRKCSIKVNATTVRVDSPEKVFA